MGIPDRAKFLRFWFPVILYSGIIFYASSIPDVKMPLSEVQFDKILHILAYMPFGFLLARGIWSLNASISERMLWLLVFSISCMFGASDEFHQSFVPGRNAGGIDLMADTIGGMIGGYLYLPLTRKTKIK